MKFKRLLIISLFTSVLFGTPLPVLQHAKVYKEQKISGWVMSEKLDGVRGYWDGEAMYTKQGSRLFPPKGFTAGFPPFALDGELWHKRQDFEYVQSAVLQRQGTWKGISYNIFEVPHAEGDFFARLKKAEVWFQKHPNPYVKIIPQHPCPDQTTLQKYLRKVTAKGGEGVMVKEPGLDYFQGRSAHLLKVKEAHDMEGVVTRVIYNSSGKMKSLELQLDDGIRFRLGNGFSDQEREHPPLVGQRVTFKYYGFTKNAKPKFASFIRIRKSLNTKHHP